MPWPEETPVETIHGDRRDHRRYRIALDLRWKLVRRRKVLDTGTGVTIDLSSGGLLFDAGRPLALGLNVELSIAWPALLHDVAPMQLMVFGRVVRTHGSRTAIYMAQHEFRTAGIPHDRRAPLAARTPSALFGAGPARKFETLH